MLGQGVNTLPHLDTNMSRNTFFIGIMLLVLSIPCALFGAWGLAYVLALFGAVLFYFGHMIYKKDKDYG